MSGRVDCFRAGTSRALLLSHFPSLSLMLQLKGNSLISLFLLRVREAQDSDPSPLLGGSLDAFSQKRNESGSFAEMWTNPESLT